MAYSLLFTVLLILFSLHAWCQTVQDAWTAPASPDRSTSLQGGNPFTLRWKSDLQSQFKTYCTLCNVQKLDLWVTSFSSNTYNYKIAGSLDITTTLSYQWDVNVPSAALAATNLWVLRFTPFGAQAPFTEQISSPGFFISGPPQASTIVSVITVQPSSATSSVPKSSTVINTSTAVSNTVTSTNGSMTSAPAVTNTASNAESTSRSNTWIAGVVIGPIVGIALGAALMWFLLGKRRKNKQARHDQGNTAHTPDGYHLAHTPSQDLKDTYSHTVAQQPSSELVGSHVWQHQPGNHNQNIAEAPDVSREPAELWHGNYR